DMVDSQGAPMPAILADRFGKEAVAVFAVVSGVGWRKTPILSIWREVIGRRTDAAAGDIEGPMSPEIGAVAVNGKRGIVIEADGETAAPSLLLHAAELEIDLPLDVLIEQNATPMSFPEGGRLGGIGVAVGHGPLGPHPEVVVLLVQVLIECAVERESL